MKNSDIHHHLKSLLGIRAPAAVVVILIAISFLIPLPDGRSEHANTIYEFFGLHWQAFQRGRIWQILTYGFLHGGGFHLLVNGIGIILLGSRVEQILGTRRFFHVCLFGLLGGGLAHLAIAPGDPGAPILVGFSAAVMALLLLMTTLSPESRMWPLPVHGRALGLGILAAEGILALMDPALGVPGFSHAGVWISDHGGASWFKIAHACHFGGGLAGWLYGRWILRHRVSLKNLRRARKRREAD